MELPRFKIGDRVKIIDHDIPDIFPGDYDNGQNCREHFAAQSGYGAGSIVERNKLSGLTSGWNWVKWDGHDDAQPYPHEYLCYENGHSRMTDPDMELDEIHAFQDLVNGG
jgi:hypothetical protein